MIKPETDLSLYPLPDQYFMMYEVLACRSHPHSNSSVCPILWKVMRQEVFELIKNFSVRIIKMKLYLKYIVFSLFVQLFYINNVLAQPAPPHLSLSTQAHSVTVSWSAVHNAAGYRLYYAPYPEQAPVESIDMGQAQSFSAELWEGAAFYVAVTAYSDSEESKVSNIESFVIQGAVNDASFYPVFSRNGPAVLQQNYWTYRINDGEPMTINDSGLQLTMTFNDIVVELDSDSLTKKARFDGAFSGSASGTFTTEVSQLLAFSEQTTLIDDQEISMDMHMKVSGISLDINTQLDLELFSPAEWFLDRSNLDTLPIGYIHNESGQIDGFLSGDVSISTSGFSQSSPVSQAVKTVDSWEIKDKQESMTVHGREYSNIVQVKRTTLSPSVSTSGSLSNESIEMHYWVAKGVGMIKGSGQYNFSGKELNIELIDSNLLP